MENRIDIQVLPRETWAGDLSFGLLLRSLLKEIVWEERHENGWRYAHFKRRNVPYYFSRTAIQARPQEPFGVFREKIYVQTGEPPTLKLLWDRVMNCIVSDLEFCAVNFYENERSALEWHSDDSPSIDQRRPIAILSVGASRTLWFRPTADPRLEEPVQLECGSLLIMSAGMQNRYQHCVRKEIRPIGPRLSITFRGLNGFIAPSDLLS